MRIIARGILFVTILSRRFRRAPPRSCLRPPKRPSPSGTRSSARRSITTSARSSWSWARHEALCGRRLAVCGPGSRGRDRQRRLPPGQQPDLGGPRRFQHENAPRDLLQRHRLRDGAAAAPAAPARAGWRLHRCRARTRSSTSSARRSRRSDRENTRSSRAASPPASSRRRDGISTPTRSCSTSITTRCCATW